MCVCWGWSVFLESRALVQDSMAVGRGDAGEAGAPLPGNTLRPPAHLVPLLRGSPTCFPRPPLCRGDHVALCLFLVCGGLLESLGAPLT